MWYWAEINLPQKITFYTESKLQEKGILDELEQMRSNFRDFQQPINITPEQSNVLREKGVNVLKRNFLALHGTWHWFRGNANMDAFQLAAEKEQQLNEHRIIVVFMPSGSNHFIRLSVLRGTIKTEIAFPFVLLKIYVESCRDKVRYSDFSV